jgi:membrane-associated protease RseP (regulator of RpoE activity)
MVLYGVGIAISVFCIVAHELGHLFAAYVLKVPISEFMIGSGRILWQYAKLGGTKYTIRLIPISGAVHLEPASEGISWLLVFLAGPLINLLLAALLMGLSGSTSDSSSTWQRLTQWDHLERTDGFSFAASLSRSYGLINLLPLAGFDGGQCLVLIGRIMRKKQNSKYSKHR